MLIKTFPLITESAIHLPYIKHKLDRFDRAGSIFHNNYFVTSIVEMALHQYSARQGISVPVFLLAVGG
jgi:hypothetical protein